MLVTLPTEIIIVILSYTDTQSRVLCRSVNHRLKSIIDGSDELQLQTECEIAGLTWATPRSPHRTALADLQTIQAYQKAWRTLTWTQQMSYRHSLRDVWIGNYMISYANDGATDSALNVCRIASPARGISEKRWRTQDLGFEIYSFAVDASQDLFIALERFYQPPAQAINLDRTYHLRVHFLSLATGEPHCSSTCPAIISPIHELANRGGAIGVQLTVGFRHVGILVEDFGPQWCEFWVIQWDTAVIKVHSLHKAFDTSEIDLNHSARRYPTSLQFPDPAYLIVSLIHQRRGGPAELGIIQLKEVPQEGSLDELLCIAFELPQLRSPCSYGFIRGFADQYPAPCDIQCSDDSGLFHHTETSRILAFSLTLYNNRCGMVTWELLTTSQIFRHYYKLYCLDADDYNVEFNCDIRVEGHKWTVPWRAWQKNTRLFPADGSEHGIPIPIKLSHNRVLATERVPEEATTHEEPHDALWQRTHRIVLLNFAPALALRRDMHAFLAKEGEAKDVDVDYQYHLGPEHISDHRLWSEPIVTGLPYCKITTNRWPLYHGITPRLAPCNNGLALLDRSPTWEVNSI